MSQLIDWGGVAIPSVHVQETSFGQVAPAVRQGPEGQRGDQLGLVKAKFATFTGGLFLQRDASWTRDMDRYAYNEGLMTHIYKGLFLPYKLVTQTALAAVDISGYRAANKRVHSANSTLGGSKQRWYAALGPRFYRTVGDSDHSLEAPSGGGTFTNNVTAMRELVLNNVRYLAIATDDDTDDIKGTEDPTAGTVSWTSLVTYGDGDDAVWAMEHFPTLGSGWNIFVGRLNGTNGVWGIESTASIPVTAPMPIVLEETKDIEGDIQAITTSAKSPTFIAQDIGSGTNPERQWASVTNVLSSNNSHATYAAAAGNEESPFLFASGFDVSDVPTSALITGIQVSVEGKEDDAGMNAYYSAVELFVDGFRVGINHATAAELSTSDSGQTFGASTDRWGTQLTGSNLRNLSVGIQAFVDELAGSSTVSVDHVSLTITYRLSGTQIVLPQGGFTCGKLPSRPSRLPYVAPIKDDKTGINVPRQLWFIDLDFDTGGDRPVSTLSQPNTGLANVEHCVPFAGGVAVCGDTAGGVAKAVKHVADDGTVRDLGFLSGDGYPYDVGVVNMFAAGRVLICEVARVDATDTQWWYYFDGTWHASTPLQSKSASIAALPIAWAESEVGLELRRRYRFYPSGSNTAAARMFQPANMFENPLTNNATELKQDGPLYLRTPEFDLGGPEENNKVLLTQQFLGRQISATGSTYGTVQIDTETGGDLSFASPAVSTGALNSEFSEYAVPGSGASFKLAIHKVTLSNASGTAKTPNGLPFLDTMVVDTPHLSEFKVYVDTGQLNSRFPGGWTDFTSQLKTLANTKATQRFRWGTVDVPSAFAGYGADVLNPPIGSVPDEFQNTIAPYLLFREKPGAGA